MKSVLRSIKPYWFYLICEGKKTIEVGKNYPRADDWNRTVELYCSKDMKSFNRIPKEYQEKYRKYLGKVGARFICNKVDEYNFHEGLIKFNSMGLPSRFYGSYLIFADDYKAMCLSYGDVKTYGKGKTLCGWHITDLKIYDRPKELSEFFKPCPTKEKGDCLSCDCLADNDYGGVCTNNLTRPPQSWMFVEEL